MKIFVSSPVDVFYDDDAAAKLETTNDAEFASVRGVVTVSMERWQKAQQYEYETWLHYNMDARTDRNEQHRDGFAGYAALPENVGHIVELGCGPFTNVRYIVDGHKAKSVTLLDPLIDHYERQHPNCTYKVWTLYGYDVAHVAEPIERWQTEQRFDTLVMVNTLAHCYDAAEIFKVIRRVLKPGGVLVFHEVPQVYMPLELYDVGHPLSLTKAALGEFLSEFEVMYQSGDYFIGRRA